MNGVGGEKYASKNYPTTHLLRSRGAQLEIKFGEFDLREDCQKFISVIEEKQILYSYLNIGDNYEFYKRIKN